MKTPKSILRYVPYVSDYGETIWLALPWPSGSGRIPPPYVRFIDVTGGETLEYSYRGE